MEYALWGYRTTALSTNIVCLNPYSNGICSMSPKITESSLSDNYNKNSAKKAPNSFKNRPFLKACKGTNKKQYVKERLCDDWFPVTT